MRLIDADALKKDLTRFYDNEVTAKRLIDEQPTIKPMRKKGKWHKQDNGQIYWYECSVCGCEPLRNKWNGDWEFSDFCPTCGADMREVEESDEPI